MASLIEQLRMQPPPASGYTEAVQNLMQAKSGKAIDETGGPRATNIQEQVQNKLAETQTKEVAQQANLQAQQRGQEQRAVEQQFAQQKTQLREEEISTQETYQRQVEAALNDYQRGLKTLDVNKQAAKVEQLGFQLRLSNQNYIMQLKTEAARDKITSEAAFREALQRTVFADEIDLLGTDLDFRMLLKADDAKFLKELASIDIDTAMAIAASEAKAANTQAIVSGTTKVIEAGTTYASRSSPEAGSGGGVGRSGQAMT